MDTLILNIYTSRVASGVSLQLFTTSDEGIPASTCRMGDVAKGDEDRAVVSYLASVRAGEVDREKYLADASDLQIWRGGRSISTYTKVNGWWTKN